MADAVVGHLNTQTGTTVAISFCEAGEVALSGSCQFLANTQVTGQRQRPTRQGVVQQGGVWGFECATAIDMPWQGNADVRAQALCVRP
jgi:hypothetical protein